MRRKGVIDITTAGRSVRIVSKTTICIGTPSESGPAFRLIPSTEFGVLAAQMRLAGRARRNKTRTNLRVIEPGSCLLRSLPGQEANNRRARLRLTQFVLRLEPDGVNAGA